MYEIHKLDLQSLSPECIPTYEKLIDPKFYCCLKSQDPYGISFAKIIAFEATFNKVPVGLAVACILSDILMGEIYSVYVDPHYRNQRIGSLLFARLKEEFKIHKCTYVNLIYPAKSTTTPFLQKILQNQGWKDNGRFIIRCLFDGPIFNPPWLQKNYEFPSEIEEFPWSELNEKEKEFLKHQESQLTFPRYISPFGQNPSQIEHINSLGIRYKGKIIGWMITHRISQDTIRFSALYVQKEFLKRSWIKLLVDSINRQKKSSVRWALVELNLNLIDNSWLAFANKKLIPYAQSVTEENKASLIL